MLMLMLMKLKMKMKTFNFLLMKDLVMVLRDAVVENALDIEEDRQKLEMDVHVKNGLDKALKDIR